MTTLVRRTAIGRAIGATYPRSGMRVVVNSRSEATRRAVAADLTVADGVREFARSARWTFW